MKTEAPPSNISYCDDGKKNLEQLLEAFGSMVSLEDIASAYCQAGRKVYTAGEILCNLQGSSSRTSTLVSKDELESASSSSVCSSETVVANSHAEKYFPAPRPKNRAVSMGTVSGVIGAEYARPRPLNQEARSMTKPLKLMSSEFPVSEIWDEKVPSDNATRSETMHENVEEFLLAMLGNGFQLDMNVIREVLGGCGYDVEKSMEKLMNTSASTLEMRDDISSLASQTPMEKSKDLDTVGYQENLQSSNSAGSVEAGLMTGNELELRKRDTDKHDLEKKVLQSLFIVPERFEAAPRRILPKKQVRRTRTFGQAVIEPLRDTIANCRSGIVKKEVSGDGNEENEDSYEALREAVKEYWITMKEYYRAAADAYAKGDHAQAYKLLEKGHFFMDKARETNEKSAQMLIEKKDVGEIISLDLHDYEPKEATRLLKLHLTSLSGIPSIQYLKVIIGANDDNTKERTRSKRLISKLLERDSISWTEEGNGQTMVIKVDEINPKRLSFAKK